MSVKPRSSSPAPSVRTSPTSAAALHPKRCVAPARRRLYQPRALFRTTRHPRSLVRRLRPDIAAGLAPAGQYALDVVAMPRFVDGQILQLDFQTDLAAGRRFDRPFGVVGDRLPFG